MTIQVHGVYEYDSGRKDYIHQCPESYKIYVYRKIRKFYRCLINQTGTELIMHQNINGKWIKENCKYIGQAHNTWEDLFKIKENENE